MVTKHSQVFESLAENPAQFSFFQAMQIIKKELQSSDEFDKLVLKSSPSLVFPLSDVNSLQIIPRSSRQSDIELTISFLGLVGQSSILPEHYLEMVLARLHAKDSTLLAFLDIFHQRLITLYYDVWKSNQGFPDSLIKAFAYPNQWQTGYVDLSSVSVISSEMLRAILTDYFELPIMINNFAGEWIEIDSKERSAFGRFNRLGKDAVLGSRFFYLKRRFKVEIGPVGYQLFLKLLPNGEIYQAMKMMIKELIGHEYQFDIEVKLRKRERPLLKLNNKDNYWLGWNTYLITRDKNDKTTKLN